MNIEKLEINGVTDLGPGDHLCQIYETEQEHRALLTPYLIEGLKRNEKILYILDNHTEEAICGYLKDAGADLKPYLASGQFVFLTHRESYAKEGSFDPDRMISMLKSETARAVEQGYAALRVTGEMTWALKGLPGSEKLIEYEAKLNNFLPGSRALALCQYNKQRFTPALLMDILRTHPLVAIGVDLITNSFYLPPEDILGSDLPRAILEHRIGNLLEGKRERKTLEQSELLYRRLFEAAQDGIFILDYETGRVTSVNPYLIKMLGYTAEEILGNTLGELGFVKDTLLAKEAFTELRAKGYVRYEDIPLMGKNGSKKEVEFVSNVCEVGDKKVIQCNIRDITERMKVEEKLRHQADLMENVNDAIVGSDAQFRLNSWNAAAESLYGWKAGEVLGRDGREIVRTEWADKDADKMRRLIAETGRWRGEATQTHRDGTQLSVEVSSIVLRDEDGQITGYASVNRDLTERKRAEQQLRQAQKMEAVGLLAGGVAHDFNNLITAINGYAQLVLKTLPPEDSRNGDLREILAAGDRASALTRQLLAFSRKQILKPVTLDLNAAVESAAKMLRRLIGENISLQITPGDGSCLGRLDPGQIAQVLMNLVINARDAMTKGGEILIKTEAVSMGESWCAQHGLKYGPLVSVSVADTGCGIGPEVRAHMFEPFFTT